MDPFAVPRATFELSMRLATLPLVFGAKMLGAHNDDEPGEGARRAAPRAEAARVRTRPRSQTSTASATAGREARVDAVDAAAPPLADRGGEAHDGERRRAQAPARQQRSVLPAQVPAPEQRRVVRARGPARRFARRDPSPRRDTGAREEATPLSRRTSSPLRTSGRRRRPSPSRRRRRRRHPAALRRTAEVQERAEAATQDPSGTEQPTRRFASAWRPPPRHPL